MSSDKTTTTRGGFFIVEKYNYFNKNMLLGDIPRTTTFKLVTHGCRTPCNSTPSKATHQSPPMNENISFGDGLSIIICFSFLRCKSGAAQIRFLYELSKMDGELI